MRVTIDDSGRLVIPKALRDAAGITSGTLLEVRYRDGYIELEPIPLEVTVEDRGGVKVAVAAHDVPVLTADEVTSTLGRIRSGRG